MATKRHYYAVEYLTRDALPGDGGKLIPIGVYRFHSHAQCRAFCLASSRAIAMERADHHAVRRAKRDPKPWKDVRKLLSRALRKPKYERKWVE